MSLPKGPSRYEDADHPPINRETTCLGIVELRVVHADGEAVYDPNKTVIASLDIDPASLKDPDYRDVVPFRGLQPVAGETSILSGAPAVVYLEDDARIPLTVEELVALCGHSLRPDEYFKIRERYGMLHSIHDDFYNPETGEAFQPRDEDRLASEVTDRDFPASHRIVLVW